MQREIPKTIFSGSYREGHVQGIAVDAERGFVYYSFTTMLLKTDLNGRPVGSVIHLAGHLGCITYDPAKNAIYGSLELKHDAIGQGIIARTGWNPSAEDSFYLVVFDAAEITRMDMDAEADGVMKAVYLRDVVKDYNATDEASGKPHRYGCSGIDGTALGPVFGEDPLSPPKIMVAYGVYGDTERTDNDYQVILQYDPSVISDYARPLNQAAPHHSGPEHCEEKYFLYTGNTNYGIQNLEYDSYSHNWLAAVYTGKKERFANYPLFLLDGSARPERLELTGRGGETGEVLSSCALGLPGRNGQSNGSLFPYGQTGIASLGDGSICFSQPGHSREEHTYSCTVVRYRWTPERPELFTEWEE